MEIFRDSDENELIQRTRNGDARAFEQLIGSYRIRLFTYLLGACGHRELAEDLFQETLLRVWSAMPGYRHRGKFCTWLFSIAHNLVVDARRKQQRQAVAFAAEAPVPPIASTPETEYAAAVLQQEVQAAIAQLSENQRQVFLLRLHSDMPFKKIAALLNQPLNTVLSHMHYAVSRLKKILRERDVV